MKRMQPYRLGLLCITVTLMFLLAACERPFQSGDSVLLTPDTVQGEGTPGAPLDPSAGGTVEVIDVGGQTVEPEMTPTEGEAVGTPAAGEENIGEPAGEAPTEEPVATTGPTVHVVQPGETLFNIAQRYGVSVDDIVAANSLVNPDRLEVDQSLTIPEAGFAESGATVESSTEGEPAEAPTTEEQVYVVQAGDTLFQIGLRYGFTVEELAAHNGLTDINNLEVGQEIRIPPQ